MTSSFDAARAGRIIGAALFIATLLNGLGPFAKRVGLVEREAFEQYWAHRCGPQGFKPMWLGLGRQCAARETLGFVERLRRDAPYTAYMLNVGGAEIPLKLGKDIVLGGVFVCGVILLLRRADLLPLLKGPSLLLWALLCIAILGAVRGVYVDQGRVVLAGARSLAFVLIALAWLPYATPALLEGAAAWCPALLLSQCALIPWEMLYPTGLATHWSPTRAAGTLVHPNTLGVFAVVVLALGVSFGASRAAQGLSWGLALLLVAASGSGSGWVVLGLLALVTLILRVRVSPLVGVSCGVALVLLAIPTLPRLTGRADLLDSVTEGRVSVFRGLVTGDAVAVAFGAGLGVGTNSAITQTDQGQPADSTLTLMTRQVGLIGMAVFYGALLAAMYRTRVAWPFFVALLGTSLTLNVIEAFPLNALLGLALALGLGPR